jgi:hypothetical protein
MSRKKWWLLALILYAVFVIYMYFFHKTAPDPDITYSQAVAIDIFANVAAIFIFAFLKALIVSLFPVRGKPYLQRFKRALPVVLLIVLSFVFASMFVMDIFGKS